MNQAPPNRPVSAQDHAIKPGLTPPLWAWLAMGFALMIAIGVASFMAIGASTAKSARAEVIPVVGAPPKLAPPPHVVTEAEKLLGARSLPAALELTRSGMGDTHNETSIGGQLFTMWAMNAMLLSDVLVPVDETSYALTRKDPDTARGKRLCTSGTIIQIAIKRVGSNGKYFSGLLRSNGGNIFQFNAAGSTGELVGRSSARFCGVVTGTHDYSNSGGGTGHAVSLVGMFDLPENRAAMARPRPTVTVEENVPSAASEGGR